MASLLDQKKPVLVLAGYVVTTEHGDGPVKMELRFSDDEAVDVPTEFHDFLLFMRIPRLEPEVFLWLDENGLDRASMRQLLRKDWLLAVLPGSYYGALQAFKGIRVVPTCYIQKEAENFDDFHYVTNAEHAPFIERVTTLLGGSMWESLEGEDLPTSVDRLALDSKNFPGYTNGYTVAQKAKMTLSNLHMLLENNFVRLERVKKSEEVQSGWLANLFGKKK